MDTSRCLARAFLLAALPVASPLAQSAATTQDLATDAASLLAETFVEQGLVGLQATLSLDGEPLLSQAWGHADLDHDVPLSTDTRMPIASVTKALTGVAYLRLLERGVVRADQDVRELVPEWPEKAEGPLLLSHLVNQTHGIRHYRDEVYPRFFTAHFDTLADALGVFADDDLLSPPGERFTYSSYAYSLLGLALERAAKTPFADLLQSEVLDPAGMTRTVPNDPRVPIPGRATCYSFFSPSWPFAPSDDLLVMPRLDFSYNAAGGNLLSTTEDLVRFGERLRTGALLTPTSSAELDASTTTNSGEPTGWSHGWFVIERGGTLQWRINGSNPGCWAHLRVYPEEGLVLALATNTWSPSSRDTKGLLPTMDQLHELVRTHVSRR